MLDQPSALVGRDKELEALERAMCDARRQRGRAIFLIGEDGIGKSRLALESANRALASGMRVLRGRGSATGPKVSFRPLTEALLHLFRTDEPPGDNQIGPYRGVLSRLIPDCSHGEPDDNTTSPVLLAEAVLRLTAEAGCGPGCLIVLEDLQDADPETLAAVEYLADNLERQPTVLLATARTDPIGAWELARTVARRGSGTLLELDRLDRNEVHALVALYVRAEPGEIPDQVVDRLSEDSSGNPFVVEELLRGMINDGLLVADAQGWRLVDGTRTEVPRNLVLSIARRADRLGRQGRRLLSVAAVLGRRFPLSVVQAVIGVDDGDLLSHLRAGVTAGLVTADEPVPDWYAFRHPLTAEALLCQLTPADRASLAWQAADAVQLLHPGLPGDWCQLAAALLRDAGDRSGAARLLAEAGGRAFRAGMASSAAALLDQAWESLTGTEETSLRADVLETLLSALTDAGQVDRGLRLAGALDELFDAGLDASRMAELHIQLAWVATAAGQWADGIAQVNTARALLGSKAVDQHTVTIDAVAAYLALQTPGQSGDRVAEERARRAVADAERSGLPVVACQAWQLLGVLTRKHDVEDATACFEHVEALAREHRMPIWSVRALFQLGCNDWLADGDVARLEQARHKALRFGVMTVGHEVDAVIALQKVLCGQFSEAAEVIERCWTEVSRLRLTETARQVLMTRAILAAHQGKRREMDQALAEFRVRDGERTHLSPLTLGLAKTFCALLEEDRVQARREMAETVVLETETFAMYPLAGHHGLRLLLEVLSGDASWLQYHQVATAPASGLQWNRQFVLLAHAVLLGRSGRKEEAMAATTQAEQAAAPYAMAQHLGLRLVAEAAHIDRWGDPVTWLHRAEEYFHNASMPAVASACRTLLRRIGVTVPQRRRGVDRVPRALRMQGVTVREYEVLQLLMDRPSNQALANRLYISPRTVEKHVANLIAKTDQPNRSALSQYAGQNLAISR
jgi:DNA-binding CsgD family transcriptional regulator